MIGGYPTPDPYTATAVIIGVGKEVEDVLLELLEILSVIVERRLVLPTSYMSFFPNFIKYRFFEL